MPVTATLKTGAANGANLAAYTTGSVTLAPYSLAVVLVGLVRTSLTSVQADVTLTTTGDVFSRPISIEYATRNRLEAHYLQTGSSGFTDTVTITLPTTIQQAHWAVLEVRGHDIAFPIRQTGSGTGTGTALALAANLEAGASPGSKTFAAGAGSLNQGTSSDAGMTELSDNPGSSPVQSFATAWSDAAYNAAPAMSVTDSCDWGFLAFEVAAARSVMGLPAVPRGRRR